MKKFAVWAAATGVALTGMSAQAVTIFNNGPVVNGSGLSLLTAPATTFGFGAQTASGNAVADDFTVAANIVWNVQSLNFYGYQTGSTGFTFQTASWSVVSGGVNGSVVASGTTAVTNAGLVGYRVDATTPTNTQRGIYSAAADVSDFSLAAGTYWLRWSLTGSLASGPWQPPTSDAAIGNAAQSVTNGAFATLVETGSGLNVSLPFTVSGTITVIPEPASVSLMFAGGLAVLGAVRRRRTADR